jgi:hypothetical protein
MEFDGLAKAEIWTDWFQTTEFRRFDDTPKLTNPRLQQRWQRYRIENYWRAEDQFEWRDVPLVWEPARPNKGTQDE